MESLDFVSEFPCQYGRYELLERIGRGGMAEVFKARISGVAGFEKIVVIKRLHPHLRGHPEIERMFVDEAKIGASIHHRNIASVNSLGKLESGELFIEMEYVDGTDLKRLVAHAERSGGRVPPWLALHISIEVLEALSFLDSLTDDQGRRRNVVHCDISPENIFLARTGDVKLGDFGIAIDDARPPRPQFEEARGKVGYMAPEQLNGERPTASADLFSMGVVLWECLTQRRLFLGATDAESIAMTWRVERIPPSRIVQDVPPELDEIVLELLEISPQRRPASAAELQRRLRAVLATLHPRVSATDVREAIAEVFAMKPVGASMGRAGRDRAHLERGGTHREVGAGRRSPTSMSDDAVEASPNRADPSDGAEPDFGDEFDDRTPTVRTKSAGAYASGTGYAIIRGRGAPNLNSAIPMPGRQSQLETDDITRRRTGELAPVPAAPSRVETYDIVRAASPEAAEKDRAAPVWSGDICEPLWLRSGTEPVIGPISASEAIPTLRRIIQSGHEDSVEVSGDRLRFIPVSMLVGLLGEEVVPNPSVLPGTSFSGDFETMSLTSLVGRIALLGLSGRLVCAQAFGSRIERREVHFANGRLTAVLSNAGRLKVPDLIREGALLGEAELAGCIRAVVMDRDSLHSVVLRRHGLDIAPILTRLMLQNLEELFTWDTGLFGFDHECTPEAAPEAPLAVFGVLPVLLARSKTAEELRRALTPFLAEPMECAPKFMEIVSHIGWDRPQLSCLPLFGSHKTIGQSLLDAHPIADEKSALLVAYLLRELGLIESRVSRVRA